MRIRQSPHRRKGFAALPKGKHKKLSSKGGQAKVPKGFAALSTEERRATALKGSDARWHKAGQETQNEGEPTNSAEDGRVNIS